MVPFQCQGFLYRDPRCFSLFFSPMLMTSTLQVVYFFLLYIFDAINCVTFFILWTNDVIIQILSSNDLIGPDNWPGIEVWDETRGWFRSSIAFSSFNLLLLWYDGSPFPFASNAQRTVSPVFPQEGCPTPLWTLLQLSSPDEPKRGPLEFSSARLTPFIPILYFIFIYLFFDSLRRAPWSLLVTGNHTSFDP